MLSNKVMQRLGYPLAAIFRFVLMAFVINVLIASPNARAAQSAASLESLTDSMIKLYAQHGSAAAHSKPAILARLQTVAAERRQVLASLIESNPQAVLNAALPTAIRLSFPAPVRVDLEQEVEIEGELEILHEDLTRGSRFLYKLKSSGQEYSLFFSKDPPTHLLSGVRVRVRGVRVNTSLALGSGKKNVQPLSSVLPNTFGDQRTVVILVNFRNATSQPYTVSFANNLFFTTTSNFFLENSYQQTFLSGVVSGWHTIDMDIPATNCDYNQIASKADAAATANGINLSTYRRKVYAFPSASGCSWWGLGSVGGNPSRAWINGSLQLRVAAHELGHNLGLYHSHSMDCGAVVIGGNCTTSDYGDTLDVMGSSSYHFNAFQKERLGWLAYGTSPPIAEAVGSSSYSIYPYETVSSGPKAVKILKSTNPANGRKTYYYAECRRPLGFDSGLSSNNNVLNGFVIRTGEESSGNSSYLLDMTPATSSWNDPALVVGQSFTDTSAGITLTPEFACTNSLNGSIAVSFGPLSCVRANPEISIDPATNQWVTPGGSVIYTLTVMNNDNSGCSTSDFNITRTAPSGWSSSLGSTVLAISPGATGQTTLTLTAPANAADGYYGMSATATHASDSSYTDMVNGGVIVVSSLDVTVSTDKPSYRSNQNVTITTTVTASGSAVTNAPVNLTITKPGGAKIDATVVTGSTGVATYKFRINKKDPGGTWVVDATTTASGLNGSGTATFIVQ